MQYFCVVLLFLTACTSNYYIPDTPEMHDALSYCVNKSIREANHDHLGALFGGAIGGIGGGFAGGVVEGSMSNISKKDWNAEIQHCMNDKGFEGYSSGYN